jgi:hypothetical protein
MTTDFDEDGSPPLPVAVRIAGWIWVGVGGLMLMLMSVLCVVAVLLGELRPVVFSIPFGVMSALLLRGGVQLVQAKIEDPAWVGIASLALGLFYLSLSAFFCWLLLTTPARKSVSMNLIGAFTIQGTLIFAAGVLALVGRRQYLARRESDQAEKGS